MIRMRHLVFLLAAAAATAQAQDVDATLDWSKRAALSTPASGIVRELAVAPGQRVEADALLGQLDDRRAQVTRLKLTLEEAEREYERAMELYERTVISERDRQLAEIALSVARAEHAAATAELTRARVDLEDTRLTAPFAGVVVGVHVTPGETNSNDQAVTPMVTLASDRPMLARAWVSQDVQAGLALDREVGVRVGGRRRDKISTLPATIRLSR